MSLYYLYSYIPRRRLAGSCKLLILLNKKPVASVLAALSTPLPHRGKPRSSPPATPPTIPGNTIGKIGWKHLRDRPSLGKKSRIADLRRQRNSLLTILSPMNT